MRISVTSLFIGLFLTAGLSSQVKLPTMYSVDPGTGRIGDVLAVTGENLGKETVADLYLTDGKADFKAPIIEQTATSIKFKIPPDAKPGRLSLMVLTRDDPPRLIEEPVKITVEPATTGSVDAKPGARRTLIHSL